MGGAGAKKKNATKNPRSARNAEIANTSPPEGGTPNPPNPCPLVFIRGKSSLRSVRSFAAKVCFFRVFGG
jgi:hypothetical protein